YEVKKSQSYTRLFDVDIDTTRNFEIEFVANVPTRNGWVSWANFSWNGEPDIKRSRKYTWTIRQDGYMRIFHRLPGAKWPSKLREGPMKIKHNGYNKYTVRRRGGNYFFYVNEQAVNTMPYKPLKGQTLGIGAGADNKRGMAIYDYVKVS